MNLLGLLFSVAVILLTFAFLLRHSFGFGLGTTLSHDNVLLSSERYMLRGKPDRLVQRGKKVIPEEKKPGRFLSPVFPMRLGDRLTHHETLIDRWGCHQGVHSVFR